MAPEKQVACISSSDVAACLVRARSPFLVEHELGARLEWGCADDLLQCRFAQAAVWHTLLSPDGIVGHYDRSKWAVDALCDDSGERQLHWRPLLGQSKAVVEAARPPRHIALADEPLKGAWRHWLGQSEDHLELSSSRGSQKFKVYLRGRLPANMVEELLGDTIFESLQKTGALGGQPAVTLYLSEQGLQTNLHTDEHGGFLVQVLGRKRVVVFSPGKSKPLRAPTWGDDSVPCGARRSWFDSGVPVEEGWDTNPPFVGLEGREFEVGPGQALFIPKGYMHDVLSRDSETLGVVLRCCC